MTVRLWFRDAFETEDVKGDLTELTNTFNVAKAKGFQFTILEDTAGDGLMVEMANIYKGREVAQDDHAYVSR